MNNYDTYLKLGFAQTDITPFEPIETIGFGREDEMSRGVLHPLSAQVSVWCRDKELCCVIAIDHIGFSKGAADDLRVRVGNILSVSKEKVMLCFSHGHSSPNESASPEYFEFVCHQVTAAVGSALEHMTPVNAAWGNARGDIGLNRRKDCEAIDRRGGILKICDAVSGSLKLILLRLTAHGNVLKSDNYLISPDYFGAVRDMLSTEYGCPVMVTQGAAGNIAPRYFKSKLNPPDACDERFIRSESALEDMAREILKSVAPVIAKLQPEPVSALTMYSRHISLIAEVPAYDRAVEIAGEAAMYCGIDGTAWLTEVRRLLDAGVAYQTDQTEVQYFIVGKYCLCGVANEVMTELALEVSERLDDPYIYFGGYTNGCTGYLPTAEEFDQGGYEVYWSMLIYYIYHGRVFPLRRQSAAELVDFVIQNAPNGIRSFA